MKLSINKKIIALSALLIALLLCVFCAKSTSVKAEDTLDYLNSVEMVDGAQVRIGESDNKNGLRFILTMSATDYATALENQGENKPYQEIYFGIIIAPAQYEIDYYPLDEENLFGSNAKYHWGSETISDKYQVINVSTRRLVQYSKDTTKVCMYGAIVDIKDENITRDFIGIGYIELIDANGESSYRMLDRKDGNTRSIYYVAKQAIAKGEDTTGWMSTNYVQNEKAIATVADNGALNVPVNNSGIVYLQEDVTVTSASTIADGQTLVVEEGVTLTIAKAGSITNNYKIINNGTIDNLGTITNAGNLSSEEALYNNGTILNSGKFLTTVYNEQLTSTFRNNGGTVNSNVPYSTSDRTVFGNMAKVDTWYLKGDVTKTTSAITFTGNGDAYQRLYLPVGTYKIAKGSLTFTKSESSGTFTYYAVREGETTNAVTVDLAYGSTSYDSDITLTVSTAGLYRIGFLTSNFTSKTASVNTYSCTYTNFDGNTSSDGISGIEASWTLNGTKDASITDYYVMRSGYLTNKNAVGAEYNKLFFRIGTYARTQDNAITDIYCSITINGTTTTLKSVEKNATSFTLTPNSSSDQIQYLNFDISGFGTIPAGGIKFGCTNGDSTNTYFRILRLGWSQDYVTLTSGDTAWSQHDKTVSEITDNWTMLSGYFCDHVEGACLEIPTTASSTSAIIQKCIYINGENTIFKIGYRGYTRGAGETQEPAPIIKVYANGILLTAHGETSSAHQNVACRNEYINLYYDLSAIAKAGDTVSIKIENVAQNFSSAVVHCAIRQIKLGNTFDFD